MTAKGVDSKRTFVCVACDKVFKSYRKNGKFCDQECFQLYRLEHPEMNKGCKKGSIPWNKGLVGVGPEPWNKGMKGLRLSPDTEFKPGPRPENRAPLMSVTIRKNDGGKYARRWLKIGHPEYWMYYSHYVWAKENGKPVPEGHVLHYKDYETLHDDIRNLELLTRAELLALNSGSTAKHHYYYITNLDK